MFVNCIFLLLEHQTISSQYNRSAEQSRRASNRERETIKHLHTYLNVSEQNQCLL